MLLQHTNNIRVIIVRFLLLFRCILGAKLRVVKVYGSTRSRNSHWTYTCKIINQETYRVGRWFSSRLLLHFEKKKWKAWAKSSKPVNHNPLFQWRKPYKMVKTMKNYTLPLLQYMYFTEALARLVNKSSNTALSKKKIYKLYFKGLKFSCRLTMPISVLTS